MESPTLLCMPLQVCIIAPQREHWLHTHHLHYCKHEQVLSSGRNTLSVYPPFVAIQPATHVVHTCICL